MQSEKLTIKTQEAMAAAQEVAREFAHQELGDLHLLHGILTTPDTIVIPMIQKVGARPDSLLADTKAALARVPQVTWNTQFKEVRGGATVDSQDPEAQFPVSDNGYLESLSLPLYPGLSDTDIDRIVTCVLSVAR